MFDPLKLMASTTILTAVRVYSATLPQTFRRRPVRPQRHQTPIVAELCANSAIPATHQTFAKPRHQANP